MFRFANRLKADLAARTQPLNDRSNRISTLYFVRLEADTTAIVTRTIAPGKAGQIKFQGSWWTARSTDEHTLIPGKTVYVVDRQTLTLYVEPRMPSVEPGQANVASGEQPQWNLQLLFLQV